MREISSSENLASIQTKYINQSLLARYANSRFFSAIKDILRNLSWTTMLDAGCGEGIILNLLEGNLAQFHLGLDYDLARLHEAKNRNPSKYVQGDLHALPVANASFELILCLEVLEHVGDPELVLRELRRISSRHILLSVPHEPWWRIGNMIRLKYLRQWGNTPEHINHWTRIGFQRLIERYFRVVEIRNPFLWTFILAERTDEHSTTA